MVQGQWTLVKMIPILEILTSLNSKQGDVNAAFLLADLAPGEVFSLKCLLALDRRGSSSPQEDSI